MEEPSFYAKTYSWDAYMVIVGGSIYNLVDSLRITFYLVLGLFLPLGKHITIHSGLLIS